MNLSKNFQRIFSSIHPLLIFTLLLGTLSSPGQLEASGKQSLRERRVQAAGELREYHQRLLNKSLQKEQRGILSAEPEASIRLNQPSSTSSTIFFFDDFDGSTHAWTTALYGGTTDDLWHLTTTASASPTHSAWAGIEGQGTYETGRAINTALISPPINLAGASGTISMLFSESYVTELGWDYCMVDASTDGVNWTPLRGGYGSAPSGDSYGWHITALDLTPFANQTITIRFYFNTGDSVLNAFPGWFVDDIVIFDQGGLLAGKKFFDVNNNSVKDIGERGVKDWTITATGPVTLTMKTDFRGRYRLPVPLGTYTVAETFEPNWTQKYPISGTWNVSLTTADTVVDSLWFGNYTQASFINGIAFHDLNNDGAYDAGDTLLPNWKILLEDTSGNVLDFDFTDSLGVYQLYIFQPGRYVVAEVEKKGWIETLPAAQSYTIDIPDLHTVSDSNNFGNFYSPLTNSILGQTFDDRNRNHLLDPGEVGAGGFTVQLWKKGNGIRYSLYRQKVTDSTGFYQFLSVPTDTYKVKEFPLQSWWQSMPDSLYDVVLDSGGTFDSLDFGNYQIAPGSVAGVLFHDINKSAVRDSGEEGLSGWHILLNGTTYFGGAESQSAYTDAEGNYLLPNIWPGIYTVSEVLKNGWSQTFPLNFGVHTIAPGPEQNMTGIDFGNIDSVYLGTFRTFRMDSLARAVDYRQAHKPVAPKATTDEFTVTLYDTFTVHPVKAVIINFSLPYIPGTLAFSKSGAITPLGDKYRRIRIDFDTSLVAPDSLTIHGISPKARLMAATSVVIFDDLTKSTAAMIQTANILRMPMPNALNVVQAIATPFNVGLGGPHSVVAPSYKEVVKSLFDARHGLHTGVPRCIDKYSSGASIRRRQTALAPQRHNNVLFAEALTFRINLLASATGKTPGGLGNLVYDDGSGAANPMNGLTLWEIAAKVDSFMSSYRDTIGLKFCRMPDDFPMDPEVLYGKLREIDSAFSGPLDTVAWSGSMSLLQVAGVRPLSDVGFLRFDASKTTPLNFGMPAMAQIPERFSLYQNYPNPFNPTTTIIFTLINPASVTVKVYNLLGQEVATLADRQSMEEGDQQLVFNAANLPSGVYFYRLRADVAADPENEIAGQTFTAVGKMVLMK